MTRRLLFLALTPLVYMLAVAARAETIATATGYVLRYETVEAASPAQPIALIFMHGKNGGNGSPLIKSLANRVAGAGFTTYLPQMPWGREWDGTAADASAVIDALMDLVARDGRKVVIGGQSMGAMFAIIYRASKPPAALVGKVLTSPGALIDLTPPRSPYWAATMPSIEAARQLEALGKGKDRARFSGTNTVGEATISESYETTPEIFLSFHDPMRLPSVRGALAQTVVPVFWSAGTRDPIANAKRGAFALIPPNPESLYLEPDGDHNSAMTAAIPSMIEWLKSRVAR